jgi:hypothetical protein
MIHSIECLNYLENNEIERGGMKRSWPKCGNNPNLYGMWKPTKTITDYQSLGPDVKTVTPEYEATELTTQLRR